MKNFRPLRTSLAEGRFEGSASQHFRAMDHNARKTALSSNCEKSGASGSVPRGEGENNMEVSCDSRVRNFTRQKFLPCHVKKEFNFLYFVANKY